MRSGGELLIASLEAQGVTTAFGVPGESYLAVLDALHDSPIDFVGCRQEGGAAYMASAWGKLTRTPGIAFVTRGPGATNASVGLHTAMQDSSPMVIFIGQASTDDLGREAFQEVDYRAFFGPLVKWATQVESADRIPETVSRAFSTALSGRPGPVVVALPENVLVSQTEVPPGRAVRIARSAPSHDELDSVIAHLDRADRPVVLVAGSDWDSAGRAGLQRFVETNQLPVVTVFRFNDLLDNHSPSYAGEAGVAMRPHVADALRNADVVLALGARFGEMTTAAYTLFEIPDPHQELIHVHPSTSELGKVLQAELPIQAHASRFAEALASKTLAPSAARDQWCAQLSDQQRGSLVAPPQPGPLDMSQVMVWLQENLPSDAIVTNGAGNFAVWPNKHFAFGVDARLVAPQSGSMGYGLPAAIAARIAYGDRTVVCFAGDGDFQMTMQELGSAAQVGAQPIVLILNNAMYGTIRMHQERAFPDRISGTAIANPDFVQIAKAYGFHAERVTTTDAFASAFARAQSSETGAVLELMVPAEMLTPTMTVDQARRTNE